MSDCSANADGADPSTAQHEPLSTTTVSAASAVSPPTASAIAHEELISHARRHYTSLGYRVHSGLQFGCELVLYADNPQFVHSDFCVLVLPPDGRVDWRRIQSLTRQMGDWKKTLILAEVRLIDGTVSTPSSTSRSTSSPKGPSGDTCIPAKDDERLRQLSAPVHVRGEAHQRTKIAGTACSKDATKVLKVTELAISTEHAPFRHRRQTIAKTGTVDIGAQRKKQKVGDK